MKRIDRIIPDVNIIDSVVYGDARFFPESWNQRSLRDMGLNIEQAMRFYDPGQMSDTGDCA